MGENLNWTCHVCLNVGFEEDDGFFFCLACGTKADDVIDTGVADEDFIEKGVGGGGGIYNRFNSRQSSAPAIKAEPISQLEPTNQSQSQFWDSLKTSGHGDAQHVKKEEEKEGLFDSIWPTAPADFGSGLGSSGGHPSFDDYYSELRMRYVMGVQLMIQMQCEALVEKFKVSPLICGLSATIWLRFVDSTGTFDDGWADEAIHDSESQKQGDLEDSKSRIRHPSEPHNMYGERAVMIWYRSLRKSIPLSCSLAVCFLCCHVAREAVLTTDILKWSLEGKLPYFAAFIDIEEKIGPPSSACPFSSSAMFRPSRPVPLRKLESLAASIALSVGLDLPPVNFYAIASRYLMQLSLSVEKILPHACSINEWAMPPELWLSANELRLPTRVCVMSILIVAIRILYNIHGFGFWEMSLSMLSGSSHSSDKQGLQSIINCEMMNDKDSSAPNLSYFQKSEFDAADLLPNLEARSDEIYDTSEYSQDLPTFLQYCKDVVFAGLEPPVEDYDEGEIIGRLWNFYQKQKGSDPTEDCGVGCSNLNQKCSRDYGSNVSQMAKETMKMKNDGASTGNACLSGSLDGDNSSESQCNGQNLRAAVKASPGVEKSVLSEEAKLEAIRHLKSDMEENDFCYIPPRVNVKRLDYLHYIRKRDEGSLTYVAHADYYILLRACARAAQVDIRSMHLGVLNFERRLAWIESRIDHCLHLKPPDASCDFCNNVLEPASDDPIDSKLNVRCFG